MSGVEETIRFNDTGDDEMSKDPCCSGCDGCLNLLLETAVFVGIFFAAIGATILPLVL